MVTVVVFHLLVGNLFWNWCFNTLLYCFGHNIEVVDAGVNAAGDSLGRMIKEHRPFDNQVINPFSGYFWAWVYFILGGLLGRHLAKDRTIIPVWSLWLVFGVSLVLLTGYGVIASEALGKTFDTAWQGYDSVPGLAMTLSALLILYRLPRLEGKPGTLISSIGANTLGIYFLHVPILRFLNPYYHAWAPSKFMVSTVGYALAVLMLSWLLALLLKRLPGVAYLFRL
jgi:surface polysaccharide O-acyltransferase-like enzyme